MSTARDPHPPLAIPLSHMPMGSNDRERHPMRSMGVRGGGVARRGAVRCGVVWCDRKCRVLSRRWEVEVGGRRYCTEYASP